jgi:hypothetical protein
VLSLLLTLLLTPVAYSLWDDLTVLFLRITGTGGATPPDDEPGLIEPSPSTAAGVSS